MDSNNWNMLIDITFKTVTYRKNFDLINDSDSFVTEYDGTISHIRIKEQLPPVTVGEFQFSVWNIGLGLKFGVDFIKLLRERKIEDTYAELMKLVDDKTFDILGYNKIILIHTIVLHPDYRKRGVLEEFVELFYRDFYDKQSIIIALVKPFQDNMVDEDYYNRQRTVEVREIYGDPKNVKYIPAKTYYELSKFLKKEDAELNEYKLFTSATKCGFKRLGDSHLFVFTPEIAINRMVQKFKHIKTANNQ